MEEYAIVLDIGTHSIKSGTAEDENPINISRTIYSGDVYGDEVLTLNKKIEYPIEKSIIQDFDVMETFLTKIVNEKIGLEVSERPYILVDSPYNSNNARGQIGEIIFEKFESPALYMELSGYTSMVQMEKENALIVDIGAGGVNIMPYYNSTYLFNAANKQDFGGDDVDKYLSNLINKEKGISLPYNTNRELLSKIKEKLGYCKVDGMEFKKETYILPDNQVIDIDGNEIMESLLKPIIVDKKNEMNGIAQMIYDVINQCPTDCRADLYKNIILVGSACSCPGLAKRIKQDLEQIKEKKNNVAEVKVMMFEDGKTAAWTGAALIGSLSTIVEQYYTKEQYDEEGFNGVSQKFSRFA